MANVLLALLIATVVLFLLARKLRDAKLFGRGVATLLISLLVGAGLKVTINQINSYNPEKAAVVSTRSTSTHNSTSPFVLEKVDANLDCASKNIVERDSVETEAEGLPTMRVKKEYQDDS